MNDISAAVSNSSPLILFARIGRLDLIQQLFGEILIPPEVYEEVTVRGRGLPGAAAVSSASWIHSRAVANQAVLATLAAEADRGESETIALALEVSGRVAVLLDDRQGRRLARERGLRVIGSAGILVLAKGRGLLPEVRPVLDALRAAGLRLGEGAYQRALAVANEGSPPIGERGE